MELEFEKSLAHLFPEIAKLVHRDSPLMAKEVRPKTRQKLWFICENHPAPRVCTPGSLLENRQCFICCGQEVLPGFNDLATVRPELGRTITKSSPLRATEVTIRSSKQVESRCPTCGYTRLIRPLKLSAQGCGVCSNKTILPELNSFSAVKPNAASFLTEPKAGLLVSAKSSTSLEFRCSIGHIWKEKPKNIDFTPRCPQCPKDSRLESVFLRSLNDLYAGEILRNKKPLMSKAGGKLELDFWLPSIKIAFEVQDFATHSRASNVEEAKRVWKSRGTGLKKGPEYHEAKRQLASEQLNVSLFDIWEDEIYESVSLENKLRAILNFAS